MINPASIERSVSPGLAIITLSRESCKEYFMTWIPENHESVELSLQRLAAAVHDRKAQVISQEVFGLSGKDKTHIRALKHAFGDGEGPVTWLTNKAHKNLCGMHLWAVSGTAVKRLQLGGRIVGSVFTDDYVQYCRLGGLLPSDASRPRTEQAAEIFDQMDEVLQTNGMEFSQVLRTWFYNDNILDWYSNFNKVRNDFFRRKRVFGGLVPASTGVGGRNIPGTALAGGLLAVKTLGEGVRRFTVSSPLQPPAMQYGSSFSRAVELDLPDHRRLYLSGTASIHQNGKTAHVGDAEAQVKLTMQVVHAILESRGMDWCDVQRALAYFKRAKDAPILEEYRTRNSLPWFPVVVVENDICREELLFEIEVDAIRVE